MNLFKVFCTFSPQPVGVRKITVSPVKSMQSKVKGGEGLNWYTSVMEKTLQILQNLKFRQLSRKINIATAIEFFFSISWSFFSFDWTWGSAISANYFLTWIYHGHEYTFSYILFTINFFWIICIESGYVQNWMNQLKNTRLARKMLLKMNLKMPGQGLMTVMRNLN